VSPLRAFRMRITGTAGGRGSQGQPNKEMEQTNGTRGRMAAPFAAHLWRSADALRS
jgi:hypothetical protein